MKNPSMEKMQELFNKSISETFDYKYKNYDSADRAKLHELLLIKGIRNFYFTVGLQLLHEYLKEISEK